MEDRYLFKAKRVDNGEWVQGYLFDDGFENGRVFIGGLVIEKYTGTACDDWTISGSCFCEVDKSTICQCTGLKDKNGKLIWENDIVKFKRSDDKEFVGEISYVEHYGAFFVIHSGCSDNQLYAFGDYEVIGNVFDNPELLESEEN